MDVRCEKCQTEYELDEARLKPTGVTVKCTNCGHMFKIRRRANTNVGAPVPEQRTRPSSSKQPVRADSILNDEVTRQIDTGDPTAVDKERNWLIRLENGEKKECRELAVLQQWIVAGIVTRESLISRTGKTWKRLGDIGELTQYFTIADEARVQRSAKPTNEPAGKPITTPQSTMIGLGSAVKSSAAGGTILPDDDDIRTTGNFKPPPPPKTTKTPPMGAPVKPPPSPARMSTPPPPPAERPPSINATLSSLPPPPQALAVAAAPSAPVPAPEVMTPAPPQLPRRPATQPPPPPRPAPKVPDGSRATATWAADEIKQLDGEERGPQGPIGGRLGAIPNEPAFAGNAFAGRPRVEPTDSAVFAGKVRASIDDGDDDVLPARRGSKAGLLIAIMSILVIGAAFAAVYMFVLRGNKDTNGTKVATKDAGTPVAVVADAAAPVITPLVDAAPVPTDPLAAAKGELATDVESRLKAALDGLADNKDPGAPAMRVRLSTQLAQDESDRAGLLADKAEADQLRKDSKQLVSKAIADAQHAIKNADDPGANIAYADLLRMQGKSAYEIKRYLDRARKTPDAARDVALVDALVLARDGKLDDAKAALAAIDGDDNRVRFHLALIAVAQNKPADAKPLVDQILAAQPDHPGARALAAKLDTLVAKTDPLPPEEHKDAGVGAPPAKDAGGTTNVAVDPPVGGNYDTLMEQAKKYADTNCSKAMEYYAKALEIKPTSVEALTGEGYCHLDAKQFSQAYSKFSTALTVSPRYEPALAGIAEMYQQQGNKDKAIDAWHRYLDAYPGSPKAQKHLDQLGAGTPPPTNGSGSGSAGGAATPPPPPPPTPPTPDQGSAGSAN